MIRLSNREGSIHHSSRGLITVHPDFSDRISRSISPTFAKMAATWTPPKGYEDRTIVILGAGVLGRRIGEST